MPMLQIEDVAHVIQTALTPAFLLSGIAALLNVFSTRLGRVADQVDRMAVLVAGANAAEAAHLSAQLAFLKRRTRFLDIAVVLGAIGGALTCLAALLLFVGSLRNSGVATALFAAFGFALVSAIGAVAAFLAEMLLSSRGLREEVAVRQAEADAGSVEASPTRASTEP